MKPPSRIFKTLQLAFIAACLLLPALGAAYMERPGKSAFEVSTAQLTSLSGTRIVTLPHILSNDDFRHEGSRVRYRLIISLPNPPDYPLAVFVNKLSLSGHWYLNGELVGSCGSGRLEDLRCLHQSQLFTAPASVWLEGDNTLDFEIYATSRQANGISKVQIVDAEALGTSFLWQRLVQYDLVVAFLWISGVAGVLSLGLSATLPRERVYLWFGLTSIANAVALLNGIVSSSVVPIDVFNWLIFSSRLLSVPLFLLTILEVFGKSSAKITQATLAFAILAPIAIWVSDNNRQLVMLLYVPWIVVGPFISLKALSWSYRSKNELHPVAAASLLALFVGGVIDWLKAYGVGHFEAAYVVPYLYAAALAVFGVSLIRVLAISLNLSVERNIALEKQITERMAFEITQNIPLGTFTLELPVDANSPHYSFVSARYLEIMDLSEPLVGKDVAHGFTVIHPDDLSGWIALHSDATTNRTNISGSTRIFCQGAQRWISVEARSRKLPDGTIIWEGVLVDKTEQVKASESESRVRAELQSNLIKQSRMLEREELLRDMHDGFGSQLANARMQADDSEITQQEVSELLADISDELYLMVDTLRHADLRLDDALADMRYRMSSRLAHSGVVLQWEIDLSEMPQFLPRAALQILRIVQEALNNALRHSGAQVILIALSFDHAAKRLEVRIRDDGKGLSAGYQPGRGMYNMRHRAREIGAELKFCSRDLGTEIILDVPVDSIKLAPVSKDIESNPLDLRVASNEL